MNMIDDNYQPPREIEEDEYIEVEIPVITVDKELPVKRIGWHIYKYYPEKKRNEDLANWNLIVPLLAVSLSTTQESITSELVAKTMEYVDTGATDLAGYLADKNTDWLNRYEKIYKVSVRSAWADMCVLEGTTAIEENRDPVYPPFPIF